MTPVRTPFDQLPMPQQAGILSNDPKFQQFVGARTIKSGVSVATSGCAEYIRQICKIQSRAELGQNEAAQKRFDELRTEFDAWRGKIASQR